MSTSSSTPTLHPAEDYNFLRQEALAHIQKLSGKLWTDYNTHDPGITMLEILAFAVADLGFRTGHPIKDILSPINEKEERLKQFFTLAEIATTRPWGVTDYRKLLLDLDDVANAWLTRATEQEVRIYLDRNRRTFSLSNESIVGGEEIRLNGLYEVAIRFEEDPEFGDLNDNSMRFWVDIPQPAGNVATEVEVEFPFFNRLPERLRKLKEADLDRISEIADHQIGAIPDETLAWFVNLVVPEDESEQGLAQYEKEIQLEIRLLQPQDRLLSVGTIVSTLKNHLWWKEILADHYLPRLQHIQEKLAKVRQILLAHRNLCEDYFAIVTMDLQEISVNVDVEVRPGTDLEATETAIYAAIQQYLDPPLRFYSLAEMLDRGHGTDEIFDGPLLQNGFIDTEELLAQPRRTAVYGSDILQLLMAIEGVVAVRHLRMSNRIAADIVADDVPDSLRLTEPGRFQPTCDARRSKVRFFHCWQPVDAPDKFTVIQRFRATVQGNIPYKGVSAQQDLPVPTGRLRNLDAYASVQEEFPLAWGIGTAGLPANASEERKDNALQLKAYLLFFEQLMCNYLAQLQQVKTLLSVGAADQMPTYFARVANEIPGLAELLQEATGFGAALTQLIEDDATAHDRRNRLLDHLLARFNTSLVEFAALSWQKKLTSGDAHWAMAKAQFLQDFPALSSERAGAIDYSKRPESNKVQSGFQRRIAALLGWKSREIFVVKSMVVVEHILLRPRTVDSEDHTLGARLAGKFSESSAASFDVVDPWSCRLSVVLPNANVDEELHDPDWRRLMQKTIREELPAHLIVDFYWVDQDQYAAFTLAHREWRDKLYFASSRPSEETEAALNDAIDALSEEMNELRNLFGATCVVLAPKKQSQYQDNDDLAVVYDPDGQIVRAWLHTPRKPWYHQYSISESKIHLAAGIHLNGRTGKIQVGQKDSVEAIDNLNVSFYTMNQAGGVTFHSVVLTILLDKAPVLTVAAPRYDWQYRFSDVLATITDEDSRIESVTWAGGGDLPVYFRMEEATWELKINDSELWEYEVRSAPSDTLSMEVKFDVVNEDGTTTRLTGNLVAYKSHPAIAIPNPEMGATQPMSYFSAGRYLIEFADDADHGIARILIRESEFELERWGLSVSYGIGTGNRARLYISNYANFLPEFERRKTIVGNTAKARFRCWAEDVHGQPTSLAFDFVFNVDSGATWHPEMVSGQLGQYSSSRILGALKDSNGGILTRPTVDGKSRLQWASATGLGFELVSGTEPYSNLEILFASRFATYSKGFTLNPAKNSASGQFVANSVDAFGGASSTTIQLTVLDTPATATRKTKFDDARAFTEIIPTTDALYSVEDSTDGGILSLRDVSGQSWISSGKLGWRLVETIPQAEVYVNDLQTFITAFKGIAIRNNSLNRYEGTIRLMTTDQRGFESEVSLPLFFRMESAAYWTPTMVAGPLNAYAALQPLGHINDDEGILLAPTILSPSTLVWNASKLRFVNTNETNPRQRLEIYDLQGFKLFVQNQMSKDLNAGRATFTFQVRATDRVGQTTDLSISLRVDNTNASSTANTNFIDTTVAGALSNGDWLFQVEDDVDLGVASLASNDSNINFTDWGLQVDYNRIPGRAFLVVQYASNFKAKFESTPKDDVTGNLAGKKFPIIVTDNLGFRTAITLPMRFKIDTESVWWQFIYSGVAADYPQSKLIGTLRDDDNGIASVTMHNGNGGLEFKDNPENSKNKDLVVANPALFLDLFSPNRQAGTYLFELSVTTTDNYGGTTAHRITMSVTIPVVVPETNALPTWTVTPGYEGSKSQLAIANDQRILEIEDASDGGIISAAPASGSIVYSNWGLLLAVDSLSKKAYVKVVNRNLFISQLCVVGNVVGENYAITLPISVTDAKGNLKVVQIPVKVHVNHSPVGMWIKNLTIEACSDGTAMATIRDHLDGGIQSFTIISAPGYVSGQNDLVVVLESGLLVVKVGDAAQFLKFFRANFTMDYQAMAATYTMRIETVDAFAGKEETTISILLRFALPTVTVEWGTQKLMSKLAANTVLGEVSFTGPYDFVSASLTSPLSLAAFGIEVVANTTNRNAAIIRVADAVLLSKAAFEGRLRLNLNSINPAYFSLDMDLNVNLTQGQSRVVPTRLTLGATVLPIQDYYAQLVQPELDIEVEETLKSINNTTTLEFDIRSLFPSPYGASFDDAGLVSTRVTYTKPSVYVFRLTFTESFFDPILTRMNAKVSFTGSFKYGSPRLGPITVKFNFYPKK